jgi:arabinose-5-phosphate isomerase
MTAADEKNISQFIDIQFEELEQLRTKMNANMYEKAVELIAASEQNGGRVHVTGIGKTSYVAGYIASLLSSTGTPAYVLHGTEAVHGSSGQVREGDVVIAISNSGETAELKATVATVKRNGAKVIAVSGNPDSWLAKAGDTFLFAGVRREGDSLNRAPRASVLAEIFVLQGLSIILQERKGITPQQYVRWHPGGSLGKLREDEK